MAAGCTTTSQSVTSEEKLIPDGTIQTPSEEKLIPDGTIQTPSEEKLLFSGTIKEIRIRPETYSRGTSYEIIFKDGTRFIGQTQTNREKLINYEANTILEDGVCPECLKIKYAYKMYGYSYEKDGMAHITRIEDA
jgi:hypothetical protein